MDTAQWPQEIVVKPIEEIVVTKPAINSNNNNNNNNNLERKLARPQKEQALNCPRCNSTNTKFCYYNNYSLTQPRYFCKTCRRYWTEGGSLRNIPVGGGSRKNKRSSSSSSTSPSSKITRLPDLVHPHHQHHQKIINPQGQDLALGFPPPNATTTTTTSSSCQDFRNISDLVQLPNINTENSNNNNKNNISGSSTCSTTACTSTASQLSALELLTGLTSRGFSSFMPMPAIPDHPNTSSAGFSLPEFKPSLSFSLDGFGPGDSYGGLHSVQETGNGRLLFPFEDLKQVSSTTTNGIHEHNNSKEQGDSAGYWTGMLGGGSW